MDKRRRVPHHRNSDLNIRISNLLAACVKDLMDTGEPKVAESIVNVLMIEDLTSDMTSISSIASAIQSGIEEAVAIVNEAVQEAQVEVSQILGITTTPSPLSSELSSTTTTTIDAQTTTTLPLASFKCAIYENMYINTWHHTNEASPPIKNCAASSGNFEIVKNKFVKYTLRTSGSSIDELTLILFDEASTKAICTVSGIDEDFGWMDCEQNGINPSLIKTPTHETLTVYYAKGNFTTIVTRDIGFNVGRFVINVYQSPELAIPSTVQGQAPISECSVGTGAQVYTWRLKGSAQGSSQYQNCYMPSFVTLSTSQQYAPYFNIYVWLLSSLVANSIGICTQFDQDCRPPEIISTTTKTTTMTTSTTTVTTPRTTTKAQTTTATSLASFKCAIYENMYINTWHQTNEASPPIKNCASSFGNFEIVKNKFVKYTLRTSGSRIDELTLILFNEGSTKAVCTVSAIDEDFGWMDCEENGIIPSLIKTSTHETLTVYYAKGNFTTIVTRDIGFNVGRFVINVYQSPELAIHSTGICNLLSSCAANGRI
ncbi:unnamed protein product [Adineta steineri]|nr:unnamed protein product [Adineta steineri]